MGGCAHRDGRPREGQAQQHEERDGLLRGLDVGHAEAAVIAAEPRVHGLEDIRELQEV